MKHHPGTGKGGKGVRKSAAHRRAMSLAQKKYAAEHPEVRAKRAETLRQRWKEDPGQFLESSRRGILLANAACKERLRRKKALEKAAEIKYKHGTSRINPKNYSFAIREACLALPDILILQGQPDSYYEELLEYFRPPVLQAIKHYYSKK